MTITAQPQHLAGDAGALAAQQAAQRRRAVVTAGQAVECPACGIERPGDAQPPCVHCGSLQRPGQTDLR